MSIVEDVRKAVQDVIAPDLKALTVRLEEIEKRMNLRFDHAEKLSDERFKQVDDRFRQVDERFRQVDDRFKQIDDRFQQTDRRIDEGFKRADELSQSRYEMLLRRLEFATAVINANHEAVMRAVDLDRRIERIELGLPAKAEDTRKA